MALFKTLSAAVYGVDAHLIDVEVDLYASGNPKDSVTVGMPEWPCARAASGSDPR